MKEVAEDNGVTEEKDIPGEFWDMGNCSRMMQKLPFVAAFVCFAVIVS